MENRRINEAAEPEKPQRIKFRATPKGIIRAAERMDEVPKYTEYRTGLLKALSEKMAQQTLPEEKQGKFISSIGTSQDLKKLIIDNHVVDFLDRLDGIPKIGLTIYAKYVESRI